jgi:hypothetical protein
VNVPEAFGNAGNASVNHGRPQNTSRRDRRSLFPRRDAGVIRAVCRRAVLSSDSIVVKDSFHATYPDGAHDAETLLVAPDGGLFIVTKGETGAVGLYRFPRELRPGATHQLERVGKPRGSRKASGTARITDGAVSPDGTWVVLRTRQSLAFHRAADFFAGSWVEAGGVSLKSLGEPQGEGVALASDGTLYLTGEGGGKSQPGTFAKFSCGAEQQATRYISTIKQKIAQGLASSTPPA